MRWVLVLWLTLAVIGGAVFGAAAAQAACNSGRSNWGYQLWSYCRKDSSDCGGGVNKCRMDICLGFCGGGYLIYCTSQCYGWSGCAEVC